MWNLPPCVCVHQRVCKEYLAEVDLILEGDWFSLHGDTAHTAKQLKCCLQLLLPYAPERAAAALYWSAWCCWAAPSSSRDICLWKKVIVDRRCEAAHIDPGVSDCKKRADQEQPLLRKWLSAHWPGLCFLCPSSHFLLYLISILRDNTTDFPVMLLSVIQGNHERINLHLKTCKKIKKTSQTATFNKSARPWLKAYI